MRRDDAGLLTRLKISNCIQPLEQRKRMSELKVLMYKCSIMLRSMTNCTAIVISVFVENTYGCSVIN